jgi:branched-chain amino acid transport system substrate-binding protein
MPIKTCRFNWLARIRLVAIFLLCISAADLSRAESRKNPILIGGAFALTSYAASFGTAELNGATLAIEETNASGGLAGREIKLLVEDTLSSNRGTVTAVTKLISIDKTKIIIGPTWLDSFAGALPIAARNKVLLITPSAVISILKQNSHDYPLVFSTFFNLDREIQTLIEHIRYEQRKRIALIFDQDPFFEAISKTLRRTAKTAGLSIVQDKTVPIDDIDFRTALVKVRQSNSDGIIFGLTSEGSLLSFLKQRQAFCPEIRLFGIHDVAGFVEQDKFKKLLINTRYAVPAESNPDFSGKYKQRFGTEPILTAANSYDAVKILVQALRQGHETPDAISTYLLKERFNTASFGSTHFNQWGGVESGKFIIKAVK